MNVTPKNSQAFINGTHPTREDTEAQDHHVSQSSILYLLQEASKLALPAKDYAGSDSTKIPSENPEPRHSPSGCLCSTQFPDGKNGEDDSQPSFSGTFSFVHACEGSSPWEVMSLINQQCERLLHSRQSDGQEEDLKALSASHLPKSTSCPSNNSIHLEGLECKEKRASSPTVPLLTVSEEKDHCNAGETNIVKEQVHVAQSTETVAECTVQSAPNTDDGGADAQVNLSDHNYSFSVSTRCRLLNHHQEDRAEWLCSEVEVVVSPCTGSSPQSDQRPDSGCQLDHKLPYSLLGKSAEPAPSPSSVTEPSPGLAEEGAFKQSFGFTLDCNNNVKPHSPAQAKPPTEHEHTGPGISSATLGLSLPAGPLAPDHKTLRDQTEGERSETPKAQTQIENQKQAHAQAQAAPQPDVRRSRTPRKQAHPSRSVDPCDPNLQGVFFSMNTKLDDGTSQCRLLITSNYSKALRKRACGSRRCRALRLPKEASSSEEEESEPCSLSTTSKTCASCCTRKTPLWRDAEDGTPLCNACGIRYKKYRVRCTNCWHIPRKDGKSRSQCFKCGDALRLTSHHKRTGW